LALDQMVAQFIKGFSFIFWCIDKL
jgi:hypothetical protein